MAAASAIGSTSLTNTARQQNIGTSNLINKATISTADNQNLVHD